MLKIGFTEEIILKDHTKTLKQTVLKNTCGLKSPKHRGQNWEATTIETRKLYDDTMLKIRRYMNYRSIQLHQFFEVFDK